MAVTTRLNASAKPYHSTVGYVHHRTTTTTPTYGKVYRYPCHFPAAPAGSLPFPVVVAGSPFFVPAPHPTYSLPPPVFCKPAPAVPFTCTADVPSPPPVSVSFTEAQAVAAAKVQAAMPNTVKPRREPAPTGESPIRVRAKERTAGVRGRRRQAEHATSRARRASTVFTTRPPSPPLPAPEWFRQPVTTVMIRNIPIKFSPGEMMQLLDDHCARANRNKKRRHGGAGGVPSAYDFLYLRMDFRFRCNMGYAFVNLTTAEAARGLYRALHGCGWKVLGSKKVIEVCPARIQGKHAQAMHLSGTTFACDTDEFLPAIFSPPRDGASVMTPCSAATLKRVGRRDPTLHPPPPLTGATTSHRAAAARLAPPPRQAWKPIAN